MSNGVNLAIVVGHLGQDPKVAYMPSGGAVANISVATKEKWKDKQTGDAKELTTWHRVTFYGRMAEIVGEYLKKGSQIYVQGKMRTRSYEKEGQTHYVTEVIAERMQMLGSATSRGAVPVEKPAPADHSSSKEPATADEFQDDDIPF